jgi:hypothetical protein
MRPKLSFRTALLVCTLFIFQSTLAQKRNRGVGETERYNPKFSYSPPERDSVASTGLTIALLTPIFIDQEINKSGSPWTDFSKSMANDVEELLTAKGFKVRGPFSSVDEMVFSDKQNSDFIVQITIDMTVKNDRKFKTGMNLLGSTLSYKVDKGDVTVNSTVILTAISCFTSEKLWKKNLDIAQQNFTYSGTVKWDGYPSFLTEFKQDVSLYNPICKNLEEVYKSSFGILYRQFDKNEMANIAKEARKSDGARRN